MPQLADFSLDFIEVKIMIIGRTAMLVIVTMITIYVVSGQLIPGIW